MRTLHRSRFPHWLLSGLLGLSFLGLRASRLRAQAPPPPPPPPAAEPAPPAPPPAPRGEGARAPRRPAGRVVVTMPVGFSVIPLLVRHPVRSWLSLGFVIAYGDRVEGASLSSAVAWVRGPLRGLQASAAVAVVGADVIGIQASAGFGYIGRHLWGAQLTAGLNVLGGDIVGLQAAAGMNYLGGSLAGVQASAGLNLTRGRVDGVQAAMGLNLAFDHVRGAQLSAGANYARSIRGAQVGPINVAGDVRGAQIGVVNIGGRVRGVQVGVVNIARDADVPIGLINISRKGLFHLDVWASDMTAGNVGVRFGGRYLYTLIGVGVQPARCKTRWMLGAGLGVHIPLPARFHLNLDLSHWHVNEDEAWTPKVNMVNKLRLIAGYSVHRHFSIFAGVSLNVAVSRLSDAGDFSFIPGKVTTGRCDCDTTVRLWPGFVAGIQI